MTTATGALGAKDETGLAGAARIEAAFADARAQARAAFIAFHMACDPDEAGALKALFALEAAGADVIELGVPFTDPTADGPSIQRAGLRARAAGGGLNAALRIATRFREAGGRAALVLMGYANPFLRLSESALAEACVRAGVDGVIAVDLPAEEDGDLRAAFADQDLAVIRLIAPTTGDDRLERALDGVRGFLYYVSVTGVTGAGLGSVSDVARAAEKLRTMSGLPVAVGFGVRTSEDARAMAGAADGVVVGSALADAVETGGLAALETLAENLADAVRTAPAALRSAS